MRIFLILFVIAMTMTAPSALAMEQRIAAVVNEGAISVSDVTDRVKLIVGSSQLPDTPEIVEQLRAQALQMLVEEELKLQEAERLELDVSPHEIEAAMDRVAQKSQMNKEQFLEVLNKSKVNPESLRHQIQSELAWTKVVQKELRPQVSVTDIDIDTRLEKIRNALNSTEYLLAEIFMPIDDPKKQNDIRQLATKLVAEMRGGKASFFRVAQQFSGAAGAATGGDLGWVEGSQLPEESIKALAKMETGTISDPVRSLSGVHIYFLRDKRKLTAETIPTREDLGSQIGLERLERLQNRYLQDLKAAAFIESRV